MDRMKELVELLNRAAEEYYQKDNEIMTNREYDDLYDELLELEKKEGIILPDSPTKAVGYAVLSALSKVRHERRMLSLDKTKEMAKLKDFIGENEGVLSWKLDGLTIVLKYNGGRLIQAITRGNGEIGEDVTHNAMHFKNVPQRIAFNGSLTVRGEATISYSDFKRINEKLPEEEKYKNPRNLCSGTVRQLDSKISAGRPVNFYAFTISGGEEFYKDSKAKALDWVESLGFKHVGYKIVNKDNIEEMIQWFKKEIEGFDIPSDGLVLTYDSISYSISLGETSKFPRDSLAFKWEDEIKETILREIVWNTSRTGLINPVAVFEPVDLEGTTVNRASLHNLSIAEALMLGVGDTIKVYKANMIIPQVADNITRSNTFIVPDKCFVCGANTEIEESGGIKFLYCSNPNCGAQKIKSLTHFTSRDAMNIEGLSESTIEKFVAEGYLSNYMDIYGLKAYGDKIKALKGFGEKSCNKLLEAVEKSKNCNLENFIYALGIRHIGLANAKLLSRHFKGDIEGIINASEEEILEIDGFGGIMARSVIDYFALPENIMLLRQALQILNIEKPEGNTDSSLNDMTFVITGEVYSFKNRKELQSYIEKKGGKVSSSVTGKTSYLINNDNTSPSSKNKKAKELNIPIITEEEFIGMFRDE